MYNLNTTAELAIARTAGFKSTCCFLPQASPLALAHVGLPKFRLASERVNEVFVCKTQNRTPALVEEQPSFSRDGMHASYLSARATTQ